MGLTLLFAMGGLVGVVACAARLEATDTTTSGDCNPRFLQGAFSEDFIDGHNSEAIEVMLCSRRLLNVIIGKVAYTYHSWSLEGHERRMEM